MKNNILVHLIVSNVFKDNRECLELNLMPCEQKCHLRILNNRVPFSSICPFLFMHTFISLELMKIYS